MNENSMGEKKPILFNNLSECSGCSGCEAICPQNAISMKQDTFLFTYPYIDKNKCVSCLLCEKVCPLKQSFMGNNKDYNTRAYAVRHCSAEVVKNSSSGGVFTLLSDYAFEKGWGICCCLYDFDSNCTKFQVITSKEQRDSARGSKYIHSHMGEIFNECLQFLKKNERKKLLFIGLGCQVEGFRKYSRLHHIDNRVILCDLICHGQASEAFWQVQLKMLGLFETKLDKVSFKDKKQGWEYPQAYVKVKSNDYPIKKYCKLFYSGYIMRPSCYDCHFTKINRKSDLTIGDFWGVQDNYPNIYNKKGVSLVLVHSATGERILDSVKENAIIDEVDICKCMQPRLQFPLEKPKDYDKFWNYIDSKGIEKGMKKYGSESLQEIYGRRLQKVKHFAKWILRK